MKDNHIRHIGKPLGRKSNQEISWAALRKKEKLKRRQETNERNHIESKFGQGKSAYGLNKIMAKLDSTTQSWIASIFFVMNILKLSKDILCLIKTHLLSLKFGIKTLKSNLIFWSSTLQYPKVYTITYIGK